MIHVQCKNCGKWSVIDGGDVHAAVDDAGCICCPLDHHHGEAANAGTPCRPITITLMAPAEAGAA